MGVGSGAPAIAQRDAPGRGGAHSVGHHFDEGLDAGLVIPGRFGKMNELLGTAWISLRAALPFPTIGTAPSVRLVGSAVPSRENG
jgi:hypothetical protein